MTRTTRPRRTVRKTSTGQTPAHDQELLDESLEETFPASDPIAPAVNHTATGEKRREEAEGGSSELPNAFIAAQSENLNDIYQALKRGGGRESVTDANVDALIEMAMQFGDAQLEQLLRDWRDVCGDDNSSPAPGRHGAERMR